MSINDLDVSDEKMLAVLYAMKEIGAPLFSQLAKHADTQTHMFLDIVETLATNEPVAAMDFILTYQLQQQAGIKDLINTMVVAFKELG